jgi:hypothetical protein
MRLRWLVVGWLLLRRWRRSGRAEPQEAERVSGELLAIGADTLKNEREFAERFNVRGAGLIGFAAVVLGLTVNVGKDTFSQLQTHPPATAPELDLGGVGEPLFIGCFLGAVVLLTLCTVIATFAVLPATVTRLSVNALRSYADERIPIAEVRPRVYAVTIHGLEGQRKANGKKAKRLKAAGAAFVSALLLVAIDAGTLAVAQFST